MLEAKHSFRAVVNELVQGLRGGEIVLENDCDARNTPMMRGTRFHESSWVVFSSPPISVVNIRWEDGGAASDAR